MGRSVLASALQSVRIKGSAKLLAERETAGHDYHPLFSATESQS